MTTPVTARCPNCEMETIVHRTHPDTHEMPLCHRCRVKFEPIEPKGPVRPDGGTDG